LRGRGRIGEAKQKVKLLACVLLVVITPDGALKNVFDAWNFGPYAAPPGRERSAPVLWLERKRTRRRRAAKLPNRR
jgi:hypothetical protein